MKKVSFLALFVLMVISLLTISGCSKIDVDNAEKNNTEQVMCTADAKLCSDGTAVGRDVNNNCEFPACPDEKTYVGKSLEECQVIKFMCVQGKQYFSDDKGCGCEPILAESIPAETGGKLKAIDCIERTQACTREYVPVCGQVQVQCIRAPCPPVMQTFSNKCEACANNLTISYTEGVCANNES